MFIEKTNSHGKYTCYLLRENYREGGKIKHRTIANLSACSEEEIHAMRLALKHKKDLTQLVSVTQAVSLRQGLSMGAVWSERLMPPLTTKGMKCFTKREKVRQPPAAEPFPMFTAQRTMTYCARANFAASGKRASAF